MLKYISQGETPLPLVKRLRHTLRQELRGEEQRKLYKQRSTRLTLANETKKRASRTVGHTGTALGNESEA